MLIFTLLELLHLESWLELLNHINFRLIFKFILLVLSFFKANFCVGNARLMPSLLPSIWKKMLILKNPRLQEKWAEVAIAAEEGSR